MWLIFLWISISYLILAPTAMTNEKDPKISAKICFDSIGLDPELYRIGHTKASSNTPIIDLDLFTLLDFVFFEVSLWTPFDLPLELKTLWMPLSPFIQHRKFCDEHHLTFIQLWKIIIKQ